MPFEKPLQSQRVSEEEVKRRAAIFLEVQGRDGDHAYGQMVGDIQLTIRDWNKESQQEFRNEYYPGWTKEDFERLLDVLGEETLEETPHGNTIREMIATIREGAKEAKRRAEQKQRAEESARTYEKIRKEAKLQEELGVLERELEELTRRRAIPETTYEDRLIQYKKILSAQMLQLESLGWFGRLRNRELTRNLKKNITEARTSIKELQKRIEEHPLVERQKEDEEKEETKQKRIQELKERINQIKKALDSL